MSTPQKKIKIGVIGLGPRGHGLLPTILSVPQFEIVAVCDIVPELTERAVEDIEKWGNPRPQGYMDYRALLAREDIRAVIVASNWTSHIGIAVDAMNAGKYTAMEVGPSASVEECWRLVRAYEQTGMPCMLLENCCYGRSEMALYNAIRQGIFGELLYGECGYWHDLRAYMHQGAPYRLHNNQLRNGDLYPTHGAGPLAVMLGINRGNRFVSLTSMTTKARGMRDWALRNTPEGDPRREMEFNCGDVACTLIKCARGEVLYIKHSTTTPHPYSRCNLLQGTHAMFSEEKMAMNIDQVHGEEHWEGMDSMYAQIEHPLWKDYVANPQDGHGGMDYLVQCAFGEAAANGTQTPIDAYDAATWMAISALSEQSVAMGGAPVPFPDFTSGKWVDPRPSPKSKYSLDAIHDELFL